MQGDKLTYFNYFCHGLECVCGAPKLPMHWNCKACKQRSLNTLEGMELTIACNTHLEKAKTLLNKINPHYTYESPAPTSHPLPVRGSNEDPNRVS